MKGFIKEIAIAVIVAVLIMQFVKPTIVKERSMEPTLYADNYIFLSKQAYTFGEPRRGDIIVFHTNLTTQEGEEKLLIKRVIGLPGDEISILDGKVYLNGVEQQEPYIMEDFTAGDIESFTVPEGQLFVMGDNRAVSLDSRRPEIGCINVDQVIGKAFFRLFPFNRIGPVK